MAITAVFRKSLGGLNWFGVSVRYEPRLAVCCLLFALSRALFLLVKRVGRDVLDVVQFVPSKQSIVRQGQVWS